MTEVLKPYNSLCDTYSLVDGNFGYTGEIPVQEDMFGMLKQKIKYDVESLVRSWLLLKKKEET